MNSIVSEVRTEKINSLHELILFEILFKKEYIQFKSYSSALIGKRAEVTIEAVNYTESRVSVENGSP